MAYIKVEYAPITRTADELSAIAGVLRRSSETVQNVRSNLDWKVSCEENIDRRLVSCSAEIESITKRLEKTSSMLEEAVRLYQQADESLSAKTALVSQTSSPASVEATIEALEASADPSAIKRVNNFLSDNFNLTLGKLLEKVAKKAGQVGLPFTFWNGMQAIEDMSSTDPDRQVKGCANFLKFFSAAGKSAYEITQIAHKAKKLSNLGGTTARDYVIKASLGLNGKAKLKLPDSGHTSDYVTDSIKSSFTKNKGLNGVFTVVENIANVALNGYENYMDYKDGKNGVNSADRAIFETVVESVGDFLMPHLCKGAVQEMAYVAGTEMTAFSTGMATAGVTIAGEAASYYLTGDSLTNNAGFIAGTAWDGLKITDSTFKNAGFRSGMVKEGMVIVVSTIASESLPEAAVTLTRYADAGFKQMGKTVATLTRYAEDRRGCFKGCEMDI